MLSQRVQYAARRLRQSPGFSLVAIASLALGIGANTAIFSLVNTIVLREAPLSDPDGLVNVYIAQPDFPYNVFSHPDFDDLKRDTTEVFSGWSASRLAPVQIDRNGSVSMIAAEVVNGDYFSTLGVGSHLGRMLTADDDRTPGAHPVVVLGHAYWRRVFGADPGVIGRDLRLGGRAYSIVGVVDESYAGALRGLEPALYVPLAMINELLPGTDDEMLNRGNHSLFVKARLRTGVTLAQAKVATEAVADRLRDARPENWDPNARFVLVPSASVLLYPPFDVYVRASAWLLGVVVGLVLVLACTNLASFLLAHAIARRKEIAVRLALGATRPTLVGQLLTESLLLSLLGGLAGVGVAVALLRLLVSMDLPLPLPVALDLGLDVTVLSFTLLVSLAAGIVLGLIPALQSSNPDVASALKNESAGSGRPGQLRWRSAMVVAQVAMSLALLVVAGLFLRSFQHVETADPGFGREPAALMTLMLPTNRYTEDEGRLFMQTLIDRFRDLPGVETVGVIDNLHLNPLSTQQTLFNVDEVLPPPGREAHVADRATVDAAFFDAVGIRLLSGRTFNDTDLANGPPVAIVNQALADRFWPGGDATGQILHPIGEPARRIVGVVTTAKIRSIGEPPRPFVYLPYSQSYVWALTVVARTRLDPSQTAAQMLRTGRELNPDLWVWEIDTMDRHLGAVELPARMSALLLAAFAALALVLAVVGLYGVVSYSVAQRAQEVGIRMALGADGKTIVGMLTGSGVKLVAVGGAIGLAVAAAASQLLRGLLFEVGALDPVTFAIVPLVMAAAGFVAAYLPARRASRVDPAATLRG